MNRPIRIIFAITLLVWGCNGYTWAQDPPSVVDSLTDRECLEYCYAKLGAGGGGANPRNLAFGIAERGWGAVLDEYQAMTRRLGMKGIFCHNPWGHDNIWPMEWDQRVLARQYASLDKADATFFPAWSKFLSDNPDFKVVFYLGLADFSPTLQALEGNGELWQRRWDDSVQPIVRLNTKFPGRITIITDSGSDLREDGRHYHAIRKLQASGIEQGVELRPVRGYKHLIDLDVCLLFGNDVGGPRDPLLDAKERAKRYTDEELTGIRYCHTNHPGSNFANIRIMLKRGCVPIVTPQAFAKFK